MQARADEAGKIEDLPFPESTAANQEDRFRWATWSPALAMMLVSMISYVDRNAIAILIPSIQKETGLTGREYGQIVAAFSYAYTLGNPLWGMWLDRLGVRLGMLLAVLLCSLASAAHSLAAGLYSFAALRAVLGFAEGATFPGALRAVVQTLPPDRRSRGIAMSFSGGSLGAILTPFLVTPLALLFGWRAAFAVTGLAGLGWLAWWSVLGRRPDLRVKPIAEDRPPFPWGREETIAFILLYSLGSAPIGFILYMASIYLTKVFALSQGQLGALLWLPPLGWECGYFCWGWWLDRGVKAGRPPDVVCRDAFLAGTLAIVPLALAPQVQVLSLFLVMLFVAMFGAAVFIVGSLAYATRAFDKAHSGLIAGLGAGSFSLFTALMAPVYGGMMDAREYRLAFAIAALAPLAGIALWWPLRGVRESSAGTSTTPPDTPQRRS